LVKGGSPHCGGARLPKNPSTDAKRHDVDKGCVRLVRDARRLVRRSLSRLHVPATILAGVVGAAAQHTATSLTEPRRPMMSLFLTIESHQDFGRIEDMAASWATAPTTPAKIVAGTCNRLRLHRTARRTFRPRIIEALIQAVVLRGNAGSFRSLAPPKTTLSHSQAKIST
jgi:hypothetical protein